MGMVQSGSGARFALKAFQSLAVLGKMFREELQGDEPAELDVLGLIDHTHPAATQLLEDTVMRNSLANHAEGVRPLRVILRCNRRQVNGTGMAEWQVAGWHRIRLANPSIAPPKPFFSWDKLQLTTP